MLIASTATVTSRGQITLPKAVREVLGDSKSVEFTIIDNVVTMHPIPDKAGCLASYAHDETAMPFSEIRRKVRSKVTHDTAS